MGGPVTSVGADQLANQALAAYMQSLGNTQQGAIQSSNNFIPNLNNTMQNINQAFGTQASARQANAQADYLKQETATSQSKMDLIKSLLPQVSGQAVPQQGLQMPVGYTVPNPSSTAGSNLQAAMLMQHPDLMGPPQVGNAQPQSQYSQPQNPVLSPQAAFAYGLAGVPGDLIKQQVELGERNRKISNLSSYIQANADKNGNIGGIPWQAIAGTLDGSEDIPTVQNIIDKTSAGVIDRHANEYNGFVDRYYESKNKSGKLIDKALKEAGYSDEEIDRKRFERVLDDMRGKKQISPDLADELDREYRKGGIGAVDAGAEAQWDAHQKHILGAADVRDKQAGAKEKEASAQLKKAEAENPQAFHPANALYSPEMIKATVGEKTAHAAEETARANHLANTPPSGEGADYRSELRGYQETERQALDNLHKLQQDVTADPKSINEAEKEYAKAQKSTQDFINSHHQGGQTSRTVADVQNDQKDWHDKVNKSLKSVQKTGQMLRRAAAESKAQQ